MAQTKLVLFFYSDIDGIPELDYIEFEMTDHKRVWLQAEKTWFIESKNNNLDTTFKFYYKIGFAPKLFADIQHYGGAKGFIGSIQRICHLRIIDQKDNKEYSDASLVKMIAFDENGSSTGVFI